jgi:hypothetical protein
MLKRAAFLFALVPSLTFAGGVQRSGLPRSTEVLLVSRNLGSPITATTFITTVLPPSGGFTVKAITARATIAATGAGTVTYRVSDGTSNCDCAASCTATGVAGYGDTGSKRHACAGACTFAANASLTLTVPTTTCASVQPSVTNIDVRGHN